MDLVFWTSGFRTRRFEQQLEAAVTGGFTSFALPAEQAVAERGLDLGTMRRMADDDGVPIRHVETVTAWTSMRVPAGLPKSLVPRFDVDLEFMPFVGLPDLQAA